MNKYETAKKIPNIIEMTFLYAIVIALPFVISMAVITFVSPFLSVVGWVATTFLSAFIGVLFIFYGCKGLTTMNRKYKRG